MPTSTRESLPKAQNAVFFTVSALRFPLIWTAVEENKIVGAQHAAPLLRKSQLIKV
jgi:hypothetical protein